MDVVLGVAVTGQVARLALIGSSASSGHVFDEYALDVTEDAATDLADTIVGTYRSVADWDNDVKTPFAARLSGAVSIVLWALVVMSGRLIAYNWFQ